MIQYQHSNDHKLNSGVWNIETRRICPFFSTSFWALTIGNIDFYRVIENFKIHFHVGILCGLVWSAISNEIWRQLAETLWYRTLGKTAEHDTNTSFLENSYKTLHEKGQWKAQIKHYSHNHSLRTKFIWCLEHLKKQLIMHQIVGFFV